MQYAQNRPLLQGAVTSAMNQLECLPDKLHLADAAGTQFHVVLQTLALNLALNHLLEATQCINGCEIEVTPVHKRLEHGLQLSAGNLVASHHARLDHRVALPVTALALIVLLQRIKAEDQRATVAIGPQPHIDAKHKAIHRVCVQGLDQLLTDTNKKLLVGQAAASALGFARLGVSKNQIDIG